MSPQPTRPTPHISLVVRTTAGSWNDARFNRNNKAQKVVDDTIEKFGLDPTPPRPYILERAATGEPIPLDQKLEDLGLADGDIVILKAPRPTDG
jgi:hypothetical protein